MGPVLRRLAPLAVLAAVAGAAAGCTQPPRSSGPPPTAPASSTTAAPTGGQALQARLAGNSLAGEAISGDAYCSYYGPDGTTTRVFAGFAPEYGTWTVNGTDLCETFGQITGCSRLVFQPSGQVTVTSLEGSGVFSTTADLGTGNRCGG